jgi:hypothetical protein
MSAKFRRFLTLEVTNNLVQLVDLALATVDFSLHRINGIQMVADRVGLCDAKKGTEHGSKYWLHGSSTPFFFSRLQHAMQNF